MKFWADENLKGDIFRGLLQRFPNLDLIRIQDTALEGSNDIRLLDEAATAGAILITHDVNTITKYAYERVKAGLSMPGVIEIVEGTTTKTALEDLAILIEAGRPEDFENQVYFIPLH